MSAGAKSVFVFGIYLLVLGLILITVPNALLALFAVPPTSDVWIRVAGMLVFFLGIYYVQAARREMTEFIRWTAYLRSAVIVFFSAYVLLGFAPSTLILFGVVDLLGAIWTFLALRTSSANVTRVAKTI